MQKQASPHLLLASSSIYRKELLARLRIPFETASPNIDETPQVNESAAQTSLRLAEAKARALAEFYPTYLIIGSDQVALLDGIQLGKPGNHECAVMQLRQMRGRTIEFHTALSLLNAQTGHTQTTVDITSVTMRNYSDAEIETYLLREKPYDCAGSAKTEGLGIALIAAIENRDPTAIIGLPMIELVTMLKNEGVALL
ncbi:MAG: Maf family nucleotide pyrophosphatase [Formivibrio sp.]|nr:Maf family nucleotide pyrophosphatase [Formivibrio sp.]